MHSLNAVFLLIDTVLNNMVRLLASYFLLPFVSIGLITSNLWTFSLFPGTKWLSLFSGAAPT